MSKSIEDRVLSDEQMSTMRNMIIGEFKEAFTSKGFPGDFFDEQFGKMSEEIAYGIVTKTQMALLQKATFDLAMESAEKKSKKVSKKVTKKPTKETTKKVIKKVVKKKK